MNLRPLMLLPPIVLAVVGFNWMTRDKSNISEPPQEIRTAVRVMEVVPAPVSAMAVGYGRAEAIREWSALSEIQGRVVGLAPGLAVGQIVDAGTVLVEIDRTDHEIARQKSLANIAAAEAQMGELARQEENTRASLELEERILDVAQAEYDRMASLVSRGATTQASLDNTQKVLLGQQTAMTKLRNTLALFPAQQKTLEATLTLRHAELAEAERALEKATITAPFRGRVSSTSIETGQFARTGDTLMTLEDISAVEVTAEVQPLSFAPLITLALGDRFAQDSDVDISQAVQILSESGVTAEVGMSIAGLHPVWPAEIVRLRGTIDSDTGTLGLVVRVVNPMTSQRQIGRPPLNIGAFVTVTFSTAPQEGGVTIPRSSLHYDDVGRSFVYLADAESRLAAQPVEIGQVLGGDVLVLAGLEGGERLVLSDPRPPITGMALDPVPVSGPAALTTTTAVEN